MTHDLRHMLFCTNWTQLGSLIGQPRYEGCIRSVDKRVSDKAAGPLVFGVWLSTLRILYVPPVVLAPALAARQF